MKVSKSFLIAVVLLLGLFWLSVFIYLRNPIAPIFDKISTSDLAKAENLEVHVRLLSEMSPIRSYPNAQSMVRTEDYIKSELIRYGYDVYLQEVDSYKERYHNVVARYGDKAAKDIIVIGAHYDVAHDDNNPGADDNASGVAGVLEIARLLKEHKPRTKTAIEIVAYTLEEPPFFGGHSMGSARHADLLKAAGINVSLMVSLEMIGYFSDEMFSQSYPFGLFYGFYPWTGNYIAIVGRPDDRKVTRSFKSSMWSASGALPVYSINGPSALGGVNFSDHRSYWTHGWPALMITDTAFFRNTEYHKSGDTPDRLNYQKMTDVVSATYIALVTEASR